MKKPVVPHCLERDKALHILVAEDDAVAGDIIKTLLTSHGFEIDLARTGQEALEMWERGCYDLFLTDMKMPQMDGLTATGIIRKKERERGEHIPIVVMTAHGYPEVEQNCLAAGVDAFLPKPLDITKALKVIKSLICNKFRGD